MKTSALHQAIREYIVDSGMSKETVKAILNVTDKEISQANQGREFFI